MNSTNLILPQLPQNLESQFKEEEKIRVDSTLFLNAEEDLKHHLSIVYESLNIIHDLTIQYVPTLEPQATIQFLGIRLFNSAVCALKLLLSGYYQNSIAIQRDILETGFLLDFLFSNPNRILEWKNSTSQERYKQFRPKVIRDFLDSRDGFKSNKRASIYQLMCEYASHPTFPGIKLISPPGGARIGPFYEPFFLRFSIEELALRLPIATVNYIEHFEDLPPVYLKTRIQFLDSLKNWASTYLNLDLSTIDTQSLKKYIEQIERRTAERT